MNQVYTKGAYSKLLVFQVILAIAFSGLLFIISPLTFIIGIVPIIILALLGVIAVILQDKNINYGYLIFINLGVEILFWFLRFDNILSTWIGYGTGAQAQTFFSSSWLYMQVVMLIILILAIFIHIYILSSLFSYTSARKLKVAFLTTIILAVVSLIIIFNAISSLKLSNWKTLSKGSYEIQYSPTLNSFGSGNNGGWTFLGQGNDALHIEAISNNYQSIEGWLQTEWPKPHWDLTYSPNWYALDPYADTFGEEGRKLFEQKDQEGEWLKYFSVKLQGLLDESEKLSINGYQSLKLPVVPDRDGQAYLLFIYDGKNTMVKFTCNYQDNTMEEMCSKMISTFKFKDTTGYPR